VLVSISFREKCLPDLAKELENIQLPRRGFPSLSERSAFLTAALPRYLGYKGRGVSISFREKCLPDEWKKFESFFFKKARFHLFQREVPS